MVISCLLSDSPAVSSVFACPSDVQSELAIIPAFYSISLSISWCVLYYSRWLVDNSIATRVICLSFPNTRILPPITTNRQKYCPPRLRTESVWIFLWFRSNDGTWMEISPSLSWKHISRNLLDREKGDWTSWYSLHFLYRPYRHPIQTWPTFHSSAISWPVLEIAALSRAK